MDRSPRDHTATELRSCTDTEPPSDLTLHDAAALYAVSARTLAHHIRCGRLTAYKTAGAHGRQWRVTRDALDAAGYPARTPTARTDIPEHPLVEQLRRELTGARRSAAAERRRADDLDRRLGHALLECGHLRAAVTRATGTAVRPDDELLDLDSARRLITTVRASPSERQRASAAGPGSRAHCD